MFDVRKNLGEGMISISETNWGTLKLRCQNIINNNVIIFVIIMAAVVVVVVVSVVTSVAVMVAV